MAQHKQCEKRARQSLKKQLANRRCKTILAKSLSKIRAVTVKKDGLALLPLIVQTIDKSVKNNVIHKNAASRYQSRITKYINSLYHLDAHRRSILLKNPREFYFLF